MLVFQILLNLRSSLLPVLCADITIQDGEQKQPLVGRVQIYSKHRFPSTGSELIRQAGANSAPSRLSFPKWHIISETLLTFSWLREHWWHSQPAPIMLLICQGFYNFFHSPAPALLPPLPECQTPCKPGSPSFKQGMPWLPPKT